MAPTATRRAMTTRLRMNKITLTLAIAIAAMLCNSCGSKPTNTSTKGIAKIYCEESFRNILDQEVEVFEYSYPDASIMVSYSSENASIDSLMHRATDMIVTTRDLTAEQHEILQKQGRAHRSRVIAVDAIAVIVNNDNDIDELTVSELGEICRGESVYWGEVFPTRLKRDSIKVVFDGTGSGVMNYVKAQFMNGKSFGPHVFAQRSTEDVFRAVQSHRNAIGLVGVSWINGNLSSNAQTMEERLASIKDNTPSNIDFTNRIKVMAIRPDTAITARKPYQAYIYSGEYPLTRKVYAIDASAGGTLDHGFYSFLTGVIGQKIILQTGVVPAAEPVRLVETVK